jgi:hypothetical protein
MVLYPKSEKKKTPVFKENLRRFIATIDFRSEILSKEKFKFKNNKVSPSLVGNPIARIILVTIFQ